jgi:hypothetical protein
MGTERTPDIKVIISSAIQNKGADATVVKPYSISRVVETIRGVLGMGCSAYDPSTIQYPRTPASCGQGS